MTKSGLMEINTMQEGSYFKKDAAEECVQYR